MPLVPSLCRPTRRLPIGTLLGGLLTFAIALFVGSVRAYAADEKPAAAPASRPNILWITCEDISPNLGCYGDTYARTPHLDALAAGSVRYTHAFSPIGVCAPSRSCLITGMYPPSIGTHPMRCQGRLPAEARCFPEHLRRAGYHCTNNVKTDYNFAASKETWDESSAKAHWRSRKPGQPFFAVFNFTSCHESQIRLPEAAYRKRVESLAPDEIHDPARVTLPPYHPDVPEVRRDWARYHDMITYMDREAGRVLAQLDEDRLADDTIVFFFSDHGAGMPRSKRWLYDSSTRVPFFVRFPKRYADQEQVNPGSTTDRLVGFVDFGPTVLSLAGVPIPATMQGRPFLGSAKGPPREYVHGFRDRMDERYDMLRSVRDKRFRYIRNFAPHQPWFRHQHLSYALEMPTLRAWEKLADAGKLTGPAALFMAPRKPVEELYDTEQDPWEIRNLAAEPEHRATLERLRAELARWQREILDLGLLAEADLRSRFGDAPPYDAARAKPASYPYDKIAEAADVATRLDPAKVTQLVNWLDPRHDPAVRYWAATGLGAREKIPADALDALGKSLEDPTPFVRIAAADALARHGRTDVALPVLSRGLDDRDEWIRLQTINIVDRLDAAAASLGPQLEAARKDSNPYVQRVAEHAVTGLGPGSK